jgi:CrcB protein
VTPDWFNQWFTPRLRYHGLGDGVRHNRLRADDSYQHSFRLESALQTILWISIGAILGANLRYFIAQQVAKVTSPGFPYGTLLVNITGSFVLGLFLVWTTERVLADPRWRLLIAVGFCGGYTTYSSYAYETYALLEKGQWLPSIANIAGSNLLCLLAVILGAVLARSL